MPAGLFDDEARAVARPTTCPSFDQPLFEDSPSVGEVKSAKPSAPPPHVSSRMASPCLHPLVRVSEEGLLLPDSIASLFEELDDGDGVPQSGPQPEGLAHGCGGFGVSVSFEVGMCCTSRTTRSEDWSGRGIGPISLECLSFLSARGVCLSAKDLRPGFKGKLGRGAGEAAYCFTHDAPRVRSQLGRFERGFKSRGWKGSTRRW